MTTHLKIQIQIHIFFQQKFNEFQFQRTVNYFSELTEDTIESLFQLYKVDFEMFDFSIEHFLVRNNLTKTKSDELP